MIPIWWGDISAALSPLGKVAVLLGVAGATVGQLATETTVPGWIPDLTAYGALIYLAVIEMPRMRREFVKHNQQQATEFLAHNERQMQEFVSRLPKAENP